MSFILILRRSDMSSRMRVDVVTRTVFTKGGTKSISRDARPRLIFLVDEGKPTMNPTASAPASTAALTSSSLVIPHNFTRTISVTHLRVSEWTRRRYEFQEGPPALLNENGQSSPEGSPPREAG